MYDLYAWMHDTLNMCFWTLPALIVGAIMLIVGLVHWRNQKKREDTYRENLDKKVDETLNGAGTSV